MGHVYFKAWVENSLRGIRGEYNFLVDTGASYMVLGIKEFEELKLEPIGRIKFTLADKRVVEAPIAPVKVEAMGRGAMVFVALMDSLTPLFGAFTLEP
ncbi:MAG: aspartyl protease family protein [Candidatus Bathyarchaeia archaeon]